MKNIHVEKSDCLVGFSGVDRKTGKARVFLSPYKGFLGSVTDPLILPEVYNCIDSITSLERVLGLPRGFKMLDSALGNYGHRALFFALQPRCRRYASPTRTSAHLALSSAISG